MRCVAKHSLLSAVVCCVVVCAAHAQSGASAARLDFFTEPCGNPMTESQLWLEIRGTVSSVVDGDTIVVPLANNRGRMRVHLAGIGPVPVLATYAKAKARLTELALHKSVVVLVNPGKWFSAGKNPKEDTGVVFLDEGLSVDLGFALLAQGLVRFEQPQPYTMSNYSACQYRRMATEGTGNSG
jgi:endonuclease YncB( thermonuclease family)